MGRAFGFLSLLIVLAAGMWLYSRQAMSVTPAGTGNVRAVVDTVGV